MKEVIKVLTAARKLLEPEGALTKGCFARTANDHQVDYNAEGACKYCSMGAILASGGGTLRAEAYLAQAMGTDNIVKVNDCISTKQAHVLMSFDLAILMAKDDMKALRRG
jgi:hypothetical protein